MRRKPKTLGDLLAFLKRRASPRELKFFEMADRYFEKVAARLAAKRKGPACASRGR